MKVLMFGWEFPPHISGGLGTACMGLTHALGRQKTELLFVVPKLWGDESAEDMLLIDASHVHKKSRSKRRGFQAAGLRKQPQKTPARPEVTTFAQTGTRMTYIEVAAGLSAYDLPPPHGYWSPQNFGRTITSWNYSFAVASDAAYSADTTSLRPPAGSRNAGKTRYYAFSGGYGPNLMEEVKHYGDIGAVLASDYTFDLIHVHDWMTFEAGIAAKRVSKKPLVVHVHSTEVDRAGENQNPYVFQLEKRGFEAADRIITVSHWTREIVASRYGIDRSKIRVVHNGITPKDFSASFSFPDLGSHFITFLGRVTFQKGPAFFVEAARRVVDEFPDAHFIIAGSGDLLPQIIERVAGHNMSSSFHFTGFLSPSEVERIWSITDVYVMPSVSEPFGIAPLEAIQGGVPVIVSNQSGVAEVMPHAIKVNFWDVDALATAICSVLRYESLSDTLREHGKRHIETLTWDKAANRVRAVYDELKHERKY